MDDKKDAPKMKNSPKQEQLETFKKDSSGKPLTTNQGLKVNDTNNSLKSGERGSTLLEDFLLREKINCMRLYRNLPKQASSMIRREKPLFL